MNEKFQNHYRIPSARLQGYDYGQNGAYFITICTHHRVHYFGEIVPALSHVPLDIPTMRWNQMGEWAHKIWHAIPGQFPFVELGAFVVMPNHIHGILIINQTNVQTRFIASPPSPPSPSSPDIPQIGGISGNKNPMIHDNLSRIIRWYKGRCTYEMRKIHADFAWQTRFHDHIIRNERAFDNISRYILTNPLSWATDRLASTAPLSSPPST
jgi:putative transposase